VTSPGGEPKEKPWSAARIIGENSSSKIWRKARSFSVKDRNEITTAHVQNGYLDPLSTACAIRSCRERSNFTKLMDGRHPCQLLARVRSPA
jgi:hypothetical protein